MVKKKVKKPAKRGRLTDKALKKAVAKVTNERKKEDLIEKLFHPKNFFGRRYSIVPGYRITKKNELQKYYYGISGSWWVSVTWKEFNIGAKRYYEKERQREIDNDVSKLDWKFLKEK